MDDKTIYVVTDGEYSSYSIEGVFDDKELAEWYKILINSDNGIEEFTLNPENPHLDRLRNGWRMWYVSMDKNGAGEASLTSAIDPSSGFYRRPPWVGTGLEMNIDIWAKDEQHALKIANEKRAQLIAEGQWGNNEALK